MAQMTHTKIFKKTRHASEMAKIAAVLFWMPVLAIAAVLAFN